MVKLISSKNNANKPLADHFQTVETVFVENNPMAMKHPTKQPSITADQVNKKDLETLLNSKEIKAIKNSLHASDSKTTSPTASTSGSLESRPPFRVGGKVQIKL